MTPKDVLKSVIKIKREERQLMELTETVKEVFIESARILKGSTRRVFMTQIVRGCSEIIE